MDQPILPPLYATPLEAIRGTEDQLALPAAERLDFVSNITPGGCGCPGSSPARRCGR